MALDAELLDVLRRHCSSLGSSFVSQGASRVVAQPSNRVLFAKTGGVDQVLGEAESLDAMYRASVAAGHTKTLIPTIHAFGRTNAGSKAFLVTDYKNLTGGLSRQSQRVLGEKLAQMHRHGTSENGMYGFSRPTHCGATEQDNTWTSSWPDFWANQRIGSLVQRSGDKELISLERQLRETVYPLLFNEEAMKDVRPAIIHGDLWSGNAGTDENGEPIIFDPSSSFAHNEAELGIMKMFGGYDSDFFDAYHKVIPKAEPYYNERQDMYEAYHHLNHFVMFGGSYRSGTVRLFKKLIAWADKVRGGMSSNRDGPRGLRGGGSGQKRQVSAYQGCSSSAQSGYPRPPPSAGAAPSFARHSRTSPSACKSAAFPPATPSQIADYFSQMICYLWFSSGVPGHSMPTTPSRSPTSIHQPLQSSPLAPRRMAHHHHSHSIRTALRPSHTKTASAGNLSQLLSTNLSSQDLSNAIQDHLVSAASATSASVMPGNGRMLANDPVLRRLQPNSRFLRFSREILATTQVSSSVITLALIYVHRLKAAHPHLKGRDGSEFRLAISSLMLANKILDDNTYLNKTWAELSGMPLVEISKMEVEFWLGLKMELHMSKEDYDLGLHDLQMLTNDRNRAVQQRDAAMKRALQHQHQQAMQANQTWYMQPHLSVSTDGLGLTPTDQHLSHPPRLTSPLPPAVAPAPYSMPLRHSIGNGEAMSQQLFRDPHMSSFQSPSHSIQPSYEFGYTMHGYSAQTPPYHGRPNSFTLPPSPLSQGSAGMGGMGSLAPTEASNALRSNAAYMPDAILGSSPSIRERTSSVSQSVPGDSFWSMLPPMDHGLSSSTYPSGATSHTSDMSPMSIGNSLGLPTADLRPGLAKQPSSTLSGLKRDFEKTNLDALSPVDYQHSNKRFAAEPNITDDLRHYQLSSSSSRTSQSPTEARYALRSRTRAGPSSQKSARDVLRMSASPNRFATMSRQASPGNARSHLPRPMSALDVHQSHPSYHSVFTSALTPNALAAPLDKSMVGAQQPWCAVQAGSSKRVAPLQYYSLAAGEAYGTIGTYLPPPPPFRGWQVDGPGGSHSPSVVMGDGNGYQSNSEWGHTYTPLSAPSFTAHAAKDMEASPLHRGRVHSKDDMSQLKHPRFDAPFSLDAHAWPLANATASNFLFPYHLLPPQSHVQHQAHHPMNF